MPTTAQRALPAPARGMTWIPGGSALIGSNGCCPEERPVHPVVVDGFWMDEHPVTAAAFRRFVKATGYLTVAERRLDRRTTPAPPRARRAGPVDEAAAVTGGTPWCRCCHRAPVC
ncbi:SUMF1/EgtB/PvdO family nonheme iron enzyme [Kitasatospora sp. NPDC091207]|uniref:SUMF1/EgtB/PvdO family nonheme iron enzyme n=1 Tax=Kitasatospora sp. NPDC091207 TaxID=3364083 RepID=UPI0037F59BF7